MSKTLVKYVRDAQNNPIATIVATGPGQIGISICNPKDHFDKELGKRIAMGRADIGQSEKIPNRVVGVKEKTIDRETFELKDSLYHINIGNLLDIEYEHMLARSHKYFKEVELSS